MCYILYKMPVLSLLGKLFMFHSAPGLVTQYPTFLRKTEKLYLLSNCVIRVPVFFCLTSF